MTAKIKLVLLAAGAVLLTILWILLGRKKALGDAVIATTEAYHVNLIDSLQERAKNLDTSTEEGLIRAKALQDAVSESKVKLTQTYVKVGMTAEEISSRLNALKL